MKPCGYVARQPRLPRSRGSIAFHGSTLFRRQGCRSLCRSFLLSHGGAAGEASLLLQAAQSRLQRLSPTSRQSASYSFSLSTATECSSATTRRETARSSALDASRPQPAIHRCNASAAAPANHFISGVGRRIPNPQMQTPATPNHALQRTPGFGVQLPGAALIRPAQSRPVLPATKPSTARAFALRRRASMRAPGPESLSLGSLGVFTRHL